jgi:thioredoxin reductase
MAKNDTRRVAVLGAGPIGLEAALYARRLDLPVTVIERGRVGEHLHRWGHVRLFSPFAWNVTPLGRAAVLHDAPKHTFPADGDCISGHDHRTVYLEPIARSLGEAVRTETTVVGVSRRGYLKEEGLGDPKRGQQPFRLLLRDAKGKERIEEADVVLDCTGTSGQPRRLGDGGLPAVGETAVAPQIVYHLEDVSGGRKTYYAGKTVVVVGGGYSAATMVCALTDLATQAPETWVIWLARGGSSQPIKRVPNDPFRERDRLAVRANTLATRGEGNLEFHPQSIVEEIESAGPDKGFRVTARCAGKPRTFEADRLAGLLGYTPDHSISRELQVQECPATLAPTAMAAALLKIRSGDGYPAGGLGPAALLTPEPNFFILGAKSFGRNSHFLLRTGFEQVREVFTLITGQSDLDLYKKK